MAARTLDIEVCSSVAIQCDSVPRIATRHDDLAMTLHGSTRPRPFSLWTLLFLSLSLSLYLDCSTDVRLDEDFPEKKKTVADSIRATC